MWWVSGRDLMSKNRWIFIAPVFIGVCAVSVSGCGRGHDEPVYANAIAGTSTDISLKDVLLSHRLTLPPDATGIRYAARAHGEADSPLTLDFNGPCASSQALAQSIAPRLGGEADMPNSKLIGFAQSEGWTPSGTDEWYAKLSDKEEVQALVVHRPGNDCTTYIASFISLGS